MKDTRFTLRVAGEFHRRVSEKAQREGMTITTIILGLLSAWLAGEITWPASKPEQNA